MAAVTSAVVGVGGAVYGASQSRKAAKSQAKAGKQAIAAEEAARAEARADLQPFRDAGEGVLPELTSRLTDPIEISSITSDPLYSALFDNATRAITARNAAGKGLGTGDTLQDLTNASLGIGADIYNDRNRQLFNLATMGQNAAAGQGTATLSTGARIGDLHTQIGNARAAGRVGSANAITSGINTGIGLYDFLKTV